MQFKDFVHSYRTAFSRIWLIDSELPMLKMDFLEVVFQKFC